MFHYDELSRVVGFIDKTDELVTKWNLLSTNERLSESFIREYQDKLDWELLCMGQNLSEEFIREFKDKVNWYTICEVQDLSEEFIIEFQDKIDWNVISFFQTLSEGFIRQFQDKVNWTGISINQKLSDDFIMEFKDMIVWDYIPTSQKHLRNEGDGMKTYRVYLENDYGSILDQTEVEANGEDEAVELGDSIFRESEWSNGYPEGYKVLAHLQE